MIARLAGLFIAAASVLAAQQGVGTVFTHAHNNTVQPVNAGLPVQIQLPASPVRWVLDPVGQNAELTGQGVFASPGRVPGSEAVQVFDLTLSGTGPAVIILRPEGRAAQDDGLHAGHGGIHGRAFDQVFTLTLEPVAAGD